LNEDTPRVLVPPRPNLGPEPWTEIRSNPLPLPVTALLLAVVLLGFRALLRRRRARRALAPTTRQCVLVDDSPSGKLLSLAEEVRGTLITRFGPTMRARTTEEIAADPQVKEALGEQHLDPLIRLLAEADRWKFATQPGNGQEELLVSNLSGWHALHKDLLASTPARARPGSASAKEP
jgi:hypothetical protein